MKLNEEAYYEILPMRAIVELPVSEVIGYWRNANQVKDFGFVFEDLIDDCLIRTAGRETAEESLEEWFDEIVADLTTQGWEDLPNVHALLGNIAGIFGGIQEKMQLLYSPAGYHYYEFHGWVNDYTVIISKRQYGG